MSESRHAAHLQGMVPCHSTDGETEAQETNFPFTLWPLIQIKVGDSCNGRMKGMGTAPKAWVTDQRLVRPGAPQEQQLLGAAMALPFQAHTKSLPTSIGTTHVLLCEIHSCTTLVPSQPCAAGEGGGFTLTCIPGSRHIPRGAAWFIFNDTSPSL